MARRSTDDFDKWWDSFEVDNEPSKTQFMGPGAVSASQQQLNELYRNEAVEQAARVRDRQPSLLSCPRCGQDHVRSDGKRSCGAHRRKSNPLQPCKMLPARNATVCRIHGGAARQVLSAAEARTISGLISDMVNAYHDHTPPPVLLPERRAKKGGHKKPPRGASSTGRWAHYPGEGNRWM